MGQAQYFSSAQVTEPAANATVQAETIGVAVPISGDVALELDSAYFAPRSLDELHTMLDTVVAADFSSRSMPAYYFRPAVFDNYRFPDTTTVKTPLFSGEPALRWIEEENAVVDRMERLKYYLFYTHPEVVPYNINLLPEAPKRYHAVVDPKEHTIVIEETITTDMVAPTIQAAEVQKKHWIHTFNSTLQFSQAYVSPNWYQGGNNNINVLGNVFYNVKLNPKFHPNLLFETTAQYKLGVNSTPDDQYHEYNISDDLFQVNTTFGLKAAKKWYYSFTAQFKTQMVHSYKNNSMELRSAFLSPGELTAGIGMTYNYANAKKTFTFDASIAPLSYALRTCINKKLDPTQFSIDAGHTVKNSFGSSAEAKIFWKISYNISLSSRIFAFTDYNSAQVDWENKLQFDINRFLTTQIFVHARYDSATPPVADNPKWKKFQIKEILSIGFAYKFSSI